MVAKIAFLLLAGCAVALANTTNQETQKSNGQIPNLVLQSSSQSDQNSGNYGKPNSWAQNPDQSQEYTTTTEASSSTTTDRYPSQNQPQYPNGKQVPSNQRPSGVPQKLNQVDVVRILINILKSGERELKKSSEVASYSSKGRLRQARQLVRQQLQAVREFARSNGLELNQKQGRWNNPSQGNQLENINVIALLVRLAKGNASTTRQLVDKYNPLSEKNNRLPLNHSLLWPSSSSQVQQVGQQQPQQQQSRNNLPSNSPSSQAGTHQWGY